MIIDRCLEDSSTRTLRLAIFDPSFSESLFVKRIGVFDTFERTRLEAIRVILKLNHNFHPVFAISEIEERNEDLHFKHIYGLKDFSLNVDRTRPSHIIKPFDIIAMQYLLYSHDAIYLGQDEVGRYKIAQVSKKNNRAEIAD